MSYDHSKPEIAAAYEAYESLLEAKTLETGSKWVKLDDHPDLLKAYANYIGSLEQDGQIYPQTVEIIYPPQLVEKCELSGVVIPSGRVLKWLANDLESIGEYEQAKEFREVVLPFYPDPADDEDDEDDEDEDEGDYDLSDEDVADFEEIFKILDQANARKSDVKKGYGDDPS